MESQDHFSGELGGQGKVEANLLTQGECWTFPPMEVARGQVVDPSVVEGTIFEAGSLLVTLMEGGNESRGAQGSTHRPKFPDVHRIAKGI